MPDTPVKKLDNRKQTIATKSGKNITAKGERDRDLYIQWKSIPAMLRLMPIEEIEKMGYDLDDPIFAKLFDIKTKGQFTTEFKVAENQPRIWEQEPEMIEKINQVSTQNHVLKFRKDVDFSFTQKLIRNGDAPRYKLWKQIHENWSEKTESVNVNLNITPADLVTEIEERNKKIRDIEAIEDLDK